ncbi:MAG: SAM-dependent methyltransferase, partial [Paracoccaceae bacterium]
MFELRLVGIGMGNPDHLTGSAKEALQGADIILIPQKGSEKSDLAALRREICATVLIRQPRFAEFLLPTRNLNEPDY